MPTRLKLTADVHLVSSAKFLSYSASVAVLLIGSLALTGRALDLPVFQGVFPGSVMKANTALAFILSGVSLWLYRKETPQKTHIHVAQLCATAVTLLGLLTLIEYLVNWNPGIDEALFKDLPGADETSSPGRMSPLTALNFFLIGAALLLLDSWPRRSYQLGESFIFTAGLISLLGLIGYAYNFHSLYKVGPYTLHTAAAFFLLSVAILCSHPDRGFMSVVTSDNAGGLLARRLLPVALIIPIIMGWVKLNGQEAGLYDPSFGLALFVSAVICILVAVIWRTAFIVGRMDMKRRPAEEANLQLAAIVDSSDDAIISKSLDGLVVSWNKSAERIFGYTAREIIGRPTSVLMPPGRVDDELEIMRRGKQEDRIDHLETIRRRKDGQAIYVSLTISPIMNAVGRISGFSQIARNITERKEAEENIRRLNDDLERRVRDRTGELEKVNARLKVLGQRKDDFVHNVSHELRTPLTIIRESISQVSDGLFGEVPAAQRRYLDKSLVNLDRLVNIISHLLDVAKIENMKQQLYKANVNMTSLVDDVMSTFENKAKAKGLELRCESPDMGVNAHIDQEKIIQVFGNLMSNAIKFTEKGHITICLGATDDFVECKVSDTGKGIAQEDLSKLFNRFEQIGRHNGSGEKGTGLGLAISKGIIELHGGSIDVASEEGKGSTFTFTLPQNPFNEGVIQNLKSAVVSAIEKFTQFSIIQLVIATEEEQLQVQTALLHDAIVRCLYRKLDEVIQDGKTIYLVLPDTRKEDCPIVVERIKQELKIPLAAQITSYPDDGLTEDELIQRLLGTEEGADEKAIGS